jgi:hypothetical protein
LAEEIDKADIMVSSQSDEARVSFVCGNQQIDNTPRIRSAVDIVAEMDDTPVAGRIDRQIQDDPPVHLFQQIGAAVHVANCEDAHPRRSGGIKIVNASQTIRQQR